MSFRETVRRAKGYLQEERRVSVRALRRELELDDDTLEELVDELVEIQRVAVRDGRALLWTGPPPPTSAESPVPSRSPRDYTPKHLADRILQSRSALEGERKQVTVLFADVKGSMALAEQVDPEDWHRILERFFQILTDGVHRFDGTVNQYTGDGIMALFGAPIAHEGHAQRACYAALWLRDELRRYSAELRRSQGLDFAARVGINSGDVVVGKIGDDLRMDYTAQGHTVGLAARMESLAPAHEVWISEATAKLVAGYVELRDLGDSVVEGTSEPVRIFELVGKGEVDSRFELARTRGLSRFIGRDDDMGLLEQALEQTRSGNGQVVGVVAEAGMGKSRLCFEFAERCRERGIRVLQGGAVAHGFDIPLLPILQVFRQYFGIEQSTGDRAAREKIAGGLLAIDEAFRDALPVVFDLMGVPDPARRPKQVLGPEERQRQLFDVLRALVRQQQDAAVMFLEDLHWLDPASETWVAQLVESVAGSHTLLLVNFRPEYRASWTQKSWYRQLPLLPLSAEDSGLLLADLLGQDASTAGLAEAIHTRSAGNPFFAEEIIRDLSEAGSLEGTRGAYRLVTPVEALEVPGSVQAVLAARIDRLAEREKQALQAASVIGREFSEPILAVVLDWPDDDLRDVLRELRDGEFLYDLSLYPVNEYAFKHPLTQQVALDSQLRERRAVTHAAVARALEEAHPDRLDEQAALIAHHHEGAGEALEAARWHLRAAESTAQLDLANAAHWRRAYELSQTETATSDAMRIQLDACSKLVLYSSQIGIPVPERDRLAAEGRAVAERLGEDRGRCLLEVALGSSRMMDGWSDEGPLPPARRAVALAEHLDVELQLLARSQLINALYHMGKVPEALRLVEDSLAISRANRDLDLKIFGLSHEKHLLWYQGCLLVWAGRPRDAATTFELLERGADPEEQLLIDWVEAISFGPSFEELTGTPNRGLERTQRAVLVGERSGRPFLLVFPWLAMGFALLRSKRYDEALESLLRVDHLQRERGVGTVMWNLGQALLSETYLALGDAENARIVANRCIEERETWVFELRANLARARVLRTLDGADGRVDVEASLARADLLLEWSGARAYAPLIAEERARLAADLGDEEGAARWLRKARDLFAEVEAEGNVERIAKELGA